MGVAVLTSTQLGGAGYAEGVTMGAQAGTQAIGVMAVCAWSAAVSAVAAARRTTCARPLQSGKLSPACR